MILRVVRRERQFTQIQNSTLQDPRLSYRATGLLAYLLSQPDGWTVQGRVLATAKTEGRDATFAALKELEDTGYLTRTRQRDQEGRWVNVSVVFEDPEIPHTGSGFPGPGYPDPVEPDSTTKNEEQYEKPPFVAPPQLSLLAESLPSGGPKEGRKRPVKAMPEPWDFGDPEWASAKRRFWPMEAADREFDAFKSYHQSRGSKFADWQAAWRNWLVNAERFREERSNKNR